MGEKRFESRGYDVWLNEQKTERSEQLSRVFYRAGEEIKKLCDKVTGSTSSKALEISKNEGETSPKFNIKMEVYEKGLKKIVDIPILANLINETFTLPDEEILKRKIEETKVDTTLHESLMKKTDDKIKAIDENIKKEKEDYWNKVNKKEVIKEEEKTGVAEYAETLTLNKALYPESWAINMTIPLSGIEYKITGEDPTSWTLTHVSLSQEANKEEPKVESKEKVIENK